jgi:hypothetical protein
LHDFRHVVDYTRSYRYKPLRRSWRILDRVGHEVLLAKICCGVLTSCHDMDRDVIFAYNI